MLAKLLAAWVLLGVLTQFSGAWYWPIQPRELYSTDGMQPYGTGFRYQLWIVIVLLFLQQVALAGAGRFYAAAFAVFLPFLFVGLLSGILGPDPVLSLRILAFWWLMATAVVCAVQPLRFQDISWVLCGYFLAVLLLSALTAVLAPRIGTSLYETETVWRGIFYHKNQLAPVAAWGVLLAVLMGRRWWLPIRASIVVLGLAALVLSGSQGSLVTLVGCFCYVLAIGAVRLLPLPPTVKAGMTIVGLAMVAALAVAHWSDLTTALGRDPTLTGRTLIWSVYLGPMRDHWLIGAGPGMFTGISPVTDRLVDLIPRQYGDIWNVHSLYLALFGEAGLLGVIAYLAVLLGMAFCLPFYNERKFALMAGVGAFWLLSGGVIEQRGVFVPSFDGLMMLLFWALHVKYRRHRPEVTASTLARSAPPGYAHRPRSGDHNPTASEPRRW